jgi:hypothetical protein
MFPVRLDFAHSDPRSFAADVVLVNSTMVYLHLSRLPGCLIQVMLSYVWELWTRCGLPQDRHLEVEKFRLEQFGF